MICATKLRSLIRARNVGWRSALYLSSCASPARISESLTVEKLMTPSTILEQISLESNENRCPYARSRCGHSRLVSRQNRKTWMAGIGPAMTVSMWRVRSHLPGAHFGDLDRGHPRLLGPGDALAGDLHVEEVGLAVNRVPASTSERLAQL